MTAIVTVFPPGAVTVMRRTPSVKPKAARAESVSSTSRCRDSRKNPCRGRKAAGSASSAPDNSTSSTIPQSSDCGSPRKIDRSRSVLAPNNSGQSPVNCWSNISVKPRPSRQNRSDRSTSAVQIAEWCTPSTSSPRSWPGCDPTPRTQGGDRRPRGWLSRSCASSSIRRASNRHRACLMPARPAARLLHLKSQ